MVGAPVVPGRRKGGTQPVYLGTRRWGVTDILRIAGVR